MSLELRITAYRPYDDLVIGLSGELDLATTDKITDSLNAFHADRFTRTTIDCADLTFCDCTGLDTLITARRTITRAGGTLQLTHVGPRIRRIVDLTGCTRLLRDQPTGATPAR